VFYSGNIGSTAILLYFNLQGGHFLEREPEMREWTFVKIDKSGDQSYALANYFSQCVVVGAKYVFRFINSNGSWANGNTFENIWAFRPRYFLKNTLSPAGEAFTSNYFANINIEADGTARVIDTLYGVGNTFINLKAYDWPLSQNPEGSAVIFGNKSVYNFIIGTYLATSTEELGAKNIVIGDGMIKIGKEGILLLSPNPDHPYFPIIYPPYTDIEGAVYYNSTDKRLYVYNDSVWVKR
jgi:hypothetical protein